MRLIIMGCLLAGATLGLTVALVLVARGRDGWARCRNAACRAKLPSFAAAYCPRCGASQDG